MLTAEILIPLNLRDSANQLAAAIGLSLADLRTFGNPTHEDSDGNQYCLVGVQVSESWPETVRMLMANPEALPRPEFDVDAVIDMDAARATLAEVTLVEGSGDGQVWALDRMLVRIGGSVLPPGLTRIIEPD